MALKPVNKRLLLIICCFSAALILGEAASVRPTPDDPAPSPHSSPAPRSASSSENSAPQSAVLGTMDPSSPSIYLSPNGHPSASPSPQPDTSFLPNKAASPSNQAPASAPVTGKKMDDPSQSSSFSPPESKVAAPTGIKKICDATDHPELCISAITPFLTLGKTDPASVLEMVIKACTDHTHLALEAASKFSAVLHTDSETGACLDSCKDSFNDALGSFQSANAAIKTKDIGTLNSMLSAALTDFGDCADAFAGLVSPLVTFAEELIKLTSVCLAIAALIP